MQISEYLKNVCEQIKYKPARENIAEELKSHIEEQKENFMLEGIPEQEAEIEAVKVMGEPQEIGKKLNKIHKPKLDWQMLILILILSGYGVFIAMCKQTASNSILGKTITHMFIGLILGICIYFVDYRKLRKYSNLIYLVASLIVFLPVIGVLGGAINGVNYFLLNRPCL